MVRIQQLTPEAMATLPERSAMVPNHDGTLGLYTISTYHLDGRKTKEIRVMNPGSGVSTCISNSNEVKEPTWIPGTNDIICLQLEKTGETRIIAISEDQGESTILTLGEYDGPLADLCLHELPDGTIVVAVSGLADTHDNLFNPKKEETKTSGRVFDYASFREVSTWTTIIDVC